MSLYSRTNAAGATIRKNIYDFITKGKVTVIISLNKLLSRNDTNHFQSSCEKKIIQLL